jgi:hypothetical protein
MTRGGSRGVAVALLAASALLGFAATARSATGLAVLALATIPALFAVPPRGRLWLGLVVTAIAGAVALLGDLGGQASAWAAVGGLVGAGVAISARGRGWPPLGARYDTSSDPGRDDDPRQLWRALDRGEDPTGTDSPEPTTGNRRPPDAPVD